jgi:hypothetical protein
MAHLTPEQLVDLAEGTTSESSTPHLASCDACRRELADMRAVMSAAADVDIPEPSPLFWNHLSERVHGAVAHEPARPRSWRERVLQPLVLVPSLGAALAVAVFAVVLPKHALAPELPASPLPFGVTVTAPSTSPALLPSLPPLTPFGAADDPQLTIVAAVATTVDWDEMRDEVAMAAGGTSDAVVSTLTANEQRELQRLLAEEMAQPRAPEKRS